MSSPASLSSYAILSRSDIPPVLPSLMVMGVACTWRWKPWPRMAAPAGGGGGVFGWARARGVMGWAAAWARSIDGPQVRVVPRSPGVGRSGALTCLTGLPQRGHPEEVPRAGTVTAAIPALPAKWRVAASRMPRTWPDNRRLRLREAPPASRVARASRVMNVAAAASAVAINHLAPRHAHELFR